MAFEQPSLSEKIAFFTQLEAFSDDAQDEFDPREERDRLRRGRFFHGAVTSPNPRASELIAVQVQPPKTISPKHLHRINIIKPTTIKATPQNLPRTRLTNMLDQDDTIIPDSARPSSTKHTTTSLLKRADTTDSPSVTLKKRKRDSLKLQPEEEQIFKGLLFYYIPNNDIAPARRLRINKAREYGALWTQDMKSATHVVVDKGIQYKDVEKVVNSGGGRVTVVSEEYPVDCIRFRAVLDGRQRKYMLPGQPDVLQEEKEVEEVTSSEESTKSLTVKPQHKDSRRWDFVPRLGTPLRSVEGTPAVEDSQRVSLEVGREGSGVSEVRKGKEQGDGIEGDKGTGKKASMVDDELSQYILMMQEFKDLPLDNEDDDLQSTTDQIELHSDDDGERVPSGDEQKQMRPGTGKKRGSGSKMPFEDRFACNQAGAQDAYQNNPNSRTIEVLQSMANYYERVNDHWRTTGYRKAITTLKRQTVKITTEEDAFKLPHIGRRIAEKIEEIVTTNKLQRLEYAQDEPMDGALQIFLQIYGVGIKQAQQWIAQGYRTLDDVKTKAKLNSSQRVGIEHFDDLNTRIPRREVAALGAVVRKTAAQIDANVELIIGGSYRRGSDSSNDIDFIVTKLGTDSVAQLRPFLNELVRVLEKEGFLTARLASFHSGGDGSKWHGCCVLPQTKGINDTNYRPVWRRIDFLLVPESEMGGALIYFTGNDIFNRSIRLLASKKGMRLNQRGLYKDVMRGANRTNIAVGELVEGRDEKKIFEILGVKWREPHERWC